MDAAKTMTEQGNGAKPAPKSKDDDGTRILKVDGTVVSLNVNKLDGLEMRIVEQMVSLPYSEALDWLQRGSSTAALAILYVGLKRQGVDVGSPDSFLAKWDLERADAAIEIVQPEPDPTPAPEGASENDGLTADSGSDSRDFDAIGARSTPERTESIPGTSIA